MANVPEAVYLRWNLTKEDIARKADEIIERSRKVHETVGSLTDDQINYESVVLSLAMNDIDDSLERNNIDFFQHTSTDKEKRTASTDADKKLSDFDVEMSMHQDIFDNLLKFHNTNPKLSAEARRYLDRCIRDGKRNALHLPQDKQDAVKAIKKESSEKSIEFSKNCNEENTILEFTEEQLAGIPEDFKKTLEKTEDGSKMKLSLKYPHYFPAMKNCHNPETRKTLETAFNSRCIKENVPILEKLVELRHQRAQILGYPSHAAFITEIRMSKTAETVATFMSGLAARMAPLGEKDRQLMLDIKTKECKEYGYENDNTINYWDYRYFMTKVEEQLYSVDQEKLKEYFPMDVVTTGLLEIYQELLGLKYTQVENPEVWHEDVTMYSVHDEESGKLIGYFYLDLYPRDGKYGHAACFGLQAGCRKRDGTRQLPVAACVANFTKPTEDKPSLLQHDEVETFFHEFGHVMHQVCAEAEFILFAGTRVERDFVEAPSQMLENWCWEKESLMRMSKHYKDGSAIPDMMLEKLIQSRNANAGVFNLRQLLLGTFDQRIHTSAKANTAEIYGETSQEILKIPQTPGTNMSASFGHLAGGYDAQYYGYMWSEVYSMDMFYSRFKKEGILNKKVGKDYRDMILKPGGSIDAMDLLRNFLGREPNQDAFLISKGLTV